MVAVVTPNAKGNFFGKASKREAIEIDVQNGSSSGGDTRGGTTVIFAYFSTVPLEDRTVVVQNQTSDPFSKLIKHYHSHES